MSSYSIPDDGIAGLATKRDSIGARVSSHSTRPSLSIVIPAYNEEEGIASIIERTLAARAEVQARANLAAIEIIVVSDGSADRTAEIAGSYPEVLLISYKKNRGYGSAIKQGFEEATGDILGFLDADGTCDPLFFANLCQSLDTEDADVVIGARLGPESEMPAIRRLGNQLYAGLINLWGGSRITDSASGMRVLRRSSLPKLYPLPDGMHFTPAMSSLAIFDPRLKIVEIPMRYSERTGESKLNVLKDGFRFLRIIVDTALSYRPLRLFGILGMALLAIGVAYGIYPIAHYLAERRVEEWMIYRLVAVAVALTAGINLLAVGLLAQQTVSLIHDDFSPPTNARRWLDRLLLHQLIPLGVIAGIAGVILNARSIGEYLATGQVTAHWTYVLSGGLLVMLAAEFVSFGVMARVLNILTERKRFIARHAHR